MKPYIESPAKFMIRVDRQGRASDDVANLIVDRDPCVCGTRKDLHDEYGCKKYRRAA